MWNQQSTTCPAIEAHGNRVLYQRLSGSNNAWSSGNCGTVIGWSNNVFGDKTLTSDIWNQSFDACQ